MATFPEYEDYDAVGLAGLIAAREIEAREVLDAAIERIQLHNPALNAVVTTTFERAYDRAQAGLPAGPFTGVPFLLKGLSHALAGVRLTGGSRSLREHIPAYTSTLVERYEQAGVVTLGMTNVPEFGITPVTEPELHGVCANPWDPSRTAGGSSGGAGAAVASGMVPAASASDGGGSIRIPASHCGVFGLKPSRGRTPSGPVGADGLFGLSASHVLTRSVRDSAQFLDVVCGAEPGDPYAAPPPERAFASEVGRDPGTLGVGVISDGILHHHVEAECRRAVTDAAALCGDLGHRVTEVQLRVDRAAATETLLVLVAATTASTIASIAAAKGQRRPDPAEYELVTWILHLVGRTLDGATVAAAVDHVRVLGRQVAACMDDAGVDVLLTSTMATVPTRHHALDPDPTAQRLLDLLRRAPLRPALRSAYRRLAPRVLAPIPNLPLFNMTGQPAMSVPLHWSPDGLPVGVQFAARFGDEATLLRLAAQLEGARPWFDHRPTPLAPFAAAGDPRQVVAGGQPGVRGPGSVRRRQIGQLS